MATFSKTTLFRWWDLDPNFHICDTALIMIFVRTSYLEILEELGLTLQRMKTEHFNYVLFREECVLERNQSLSDTIVIQTKIAKMKPDASRWSIMRRFYRGQKFLCATITVDGAWMDTKLRKIKLTTTSNCCRCINSFPKTSDFYFTSAIKSMFTIAQIKETHDKSKISADFLKVFKI